MAKYLERGTLRKVSRRTGPRTLDIETYGSCPDKASRNLGQLSRSSVLFVESRYLLYLPFSAP